MSWALQICPVSHRKALSLANVTSCRQTCTLVACLVCGIKGLPAVSAHNSAGEDALANLSVERTENGTIVGHVRIRSKTQGIALSLGDRITMGVFHVTLRSPLVSDDRNDTAQKDNKPPV